MTRDTEMAGAIRANDEFAAMQYHLSLASEHAAKADEHLRRYQLALPGGGAIRPASGSARKGPKCVRVWTDYLNQHGPGYRQDITDGTGMKFTERGTPYTVEWEDHMVEFEDDHFLADTIMRIRGIREDGGRGAAPVLYFLWSQRWGIYDAFGVGPKIRPHAAAVSEPTEDDTLLGVVHPPEPHVAMDWGTVWDMVTDVTLEKSEPTEESEPGTVSGITPFESMDEWHTRWDPFLETLAPHDAKPSEDEQAAMLSTMPEGTEDPKAIMALAYSSARRRATDVRNSLQYGHGHGMV